MRKASFSWEHYYARKMLQPPREVLVDAISRFQKPGKVIDLGCGVGNETALLINKNWKVWAIDSQPQAIQLLRARKDLSLPSNLLTITAEFDENLHWKALPQVDLFCALHALPFCKPKKFKNVWNSIKEKILPGGKFVGHFFGVTDQMLSAHKPSDMTFLNRDEIIQLFNGFNIELFRETEKAWGREIGHSMGVRIFEVIAQFRTTCAATR